MNKSILIIVVLALACSPATDVDLDDIELLVVAGNAQTGPAFEELPDPLVVKVMKLNGKPLKDQIVNFVVVEGGGSVFAGVARSNKKGLAQERWTLGDAGPQKLEVRAVHPETGEKLVFGTFTATAVADAPEPRFMQCQDVDDGSWKSSGCFRPVLVNSTFAARFRIVASDNVTVVPGQDVTFTVDPFCMSGGVATCDNPGTVTPSSSTTDVNGEVVADWTVGPNEGPNRLIVGWIRGENGFFVTSVDPSALVPTAIQCFDIDTGTWKFSGSCGFGPEVPVNTSIFPRLRVVNKDMIPVPGIEVGFVVDPTCLGSCDNLGSVSPSSALTDALGEVSPEWTMGPNAGSNRLVVTITQQGIGIWHSGFLP